MPTKSNWSNGVDLSHPNFTLKAPRRSRYEGMGGWQPDSHDIPLLPAIGYVSGAALFLWALLKLPLLIWG